MPLLSKISFRYKLLILLGVSTAAVVVSIFIAATILRSRMVEDRADKLGAVVASALSIAQGFESQVADHQLTREQAMARMTDVVRSFRFDNGAGYLLVQRDGVTLIHGTDPARDNKPSKAMMADGRERWTAIIDILKDRDRGYLAYALPVPGKAAPESKLAYVARFEPWDIIFLAGANTGDLDGEFNDALFKLIGLGGLIILAAVGVAWSIDRDICSGLRALGIALERLAANDLDTCVPGLDRGDELRGMAESLQQLKQALEERQRLGTESAAIKARLDAQRESVESERAEAASMQSIVIRELGSGLSRLSNGDLSTRIEQTFHADYEKLRHDYNAALTNLCSAISEIIFSAGELRSGSQELTQAADDLSRRTEQQAASLQQTATTMGEITQAVQRTAGGVHDALEAVTSARMVANGSGDLVKTAVDAMEALENSAGEISQITKVIDEIAFQTNLLALNAGVEAARAGDAGRGFAVVAFEVRALAQRSGEAARQIKSLIAISTEQVGRGVSLVGETGRSLADIVEQMSKIDRIVGKVSIAAKEQSTGLGEVNIAIGIMDQVTQQNAAMVEQSTAASHSLVEQSARLVELTARFNIGDASAEREIIDGRSPPKPARQAAAAKRAALRPLSVVSHRSGS